MTVVLAHVAPENAREAFYWHRGFSAADENLFPRNWDQYALLAENNQLVCARDNDDYVGLCYYAQDEDQGRWEIGGLMVAANQRGKALGSTLTYVTLGHLLVDEQPLARGESVISHVHRDNNAPRNVIIGQLKFAYRRSIEVSGRLLPGLKTDADGVVHGDEFELTKPETLLALADWCGAWAGKLRDGTPARIELREGLTLDLWSEAFREMAD
jgi:hypothetical protein